MFEFYYKYNITNYFSDIIYKTCFYYHPSSYTNRERKEPIKDTFNESE